MDSIKFYLSKIGKEYEPQINLIERDISGGRISKDTIDQLADHADKEVLTVSGLIQETFEYLIQKYGKQFKVFNFWKCPLVTDLSPIEELHQAEYITYFWNQRVERLWDFRKTPMLKGFCFDDFTRLHNLNDLENAESLLELEFGDKVWVKCVIESLEPIAHLSNLQSLVFTAKKIEDERVDPLANLKKLRHISFPTNLFTTEQVAWLKARLPQDVQSKMLAPFWTIEKPIEMSGKKKNTFVIGKRKPFLDSEVDKARVKKYEMEFSKRVDWFASNVNSLPEDYA